MGSLLQAGSYSFGNSLREKGNRTTCAESESHLLRLAPSFCQGGCRRSEIVGVGTGDQGDLGVKALCRRGGRGLMDDGVGS